MILAAGCNTAGTATGSGAGTSDVKIGFIVKSATEPWFQSEWQFADEAAKQYGFTLVKLPATDADQLMSALDNLAAQGAQGVIVCAPDTKLGPSIVAKCEEKNLKLMLVAFNSSLNLLL
jgi:L-arabinose transport system substrate-binding protein